jgi:hypothetical protein
MSDGLDSVIGRIRVRSLAFSLDTDIEAARKRFRFGASPPHSTHAQETAELFTVYSTVGKNFAAKVRNSV